MSDARTLGLPEEFEYEGKVYHIKPRTFAREALFRRWLEREGLRAVQRLKDDYSELEYQQQLAGHRHDCATGQYAYPMPLCFQGLASIEGAKQMAYLALKEADKGVTEELVERLFNDDAKWDELRQVMQGLDDPNRQTPPPAEAAVPS